MLGFILPNGSCHMMMGGNQIRKKHLFSLFVCWFKYPEHILLVPWYRSVVWCSLCTKVWNRQRSPCSDAQRSVVLV